MDLNNIEFKYADVVYSRYGERYIEHKKSKQDMISFIKYHSNNSNILLEYVVVNDEYFFDSKYIGEYLIDNIK
ncbi:hypothetical protein FC959_16895 [Clostridium botulinum]|nr:hypothetical protein [Clostridium botulinum]